MIKLEILAACLSTIATVAAAVAAWKACSTAHRALDFEKRYAKNQYTLVQLNSTLGKLLKLKDLLSNPLGASDDEFLGVESLYHECQADLQRLAFTATRLSRRSQSIAIEGVLPSFADPGDHVADVNRAIAAGEASVADILR